MTCVCMVYQPCAYLLTLKYRNVQSAHVPEEESSSHLQPYWGKESMFKKQGFVKHGIYNIFSLFRKY